MSIELGVLVVTGIALYFLYRPRSATPSPTNSPVAGPAATEPIGAPSMTTLY
ncbi:MAG: hypothetical protein M3256_27605 [Actinomycetota bacterium]|nr:hypothetical protein [Actinomycetota bacterium]